MKCYVLNEKNAYSFNPNQKEEISAALAGKIEELCKMWQARDLHQEGNSNYDDDGISSSKKYEALLPENFAVSDGEVVGYYADHFGEVCYVKFNGTEKVKIGDYDHSDYRSGSGRVNRGHVAIVPRPDTDTNPYHDEPRFHSQEEYDDYIKWRD